MRRRTRMDGSMLIASARASGAEPLTQGKLGRRRQHHGSNAAFLDRSMSKELAFDEAAADEEGLAPADGLENFFTENSVIGGYFQIYMQIRDEVEFYLTFIEQHLNMFTWKVHTVTQVVSCILVAIVLLAALLPTRYVASALVILA